MRKLQKALSLLLVLALVFSLSLSALAEELLIAPAPVSFEGKTVILHTNDIHGAIAGYAKVAALKADYEAKGADVILVDAGDYIQGTTYVSTSMGASAVSMMNAAGYDIAILGNHEFDYGYDNLVEILKEAEFELCSSVYYNGEPAFESGYIVSDLACGLKIGFFGLETPETATKTHPAKIVGVSFPAEKELYAYAQAQADALKAEGADIVICLAHLGVDNESDPNRSVDVYANTTGIDFVIDGHSHTVMTAGPEGEPIQSTGTALANVGVVVVDENGICNNYLEDLSTYEKEDEAVKALSDSIIANIQAIYGTVFASSEVKLNGERDPGNRTEETNLGDLITDAMIWYATKDGGLEVDNDHVIAITNGGGIRATIDVGDITMNDINSVLPFGNTVAVIYISGAALLESLEASTYCTPTAVGAFPQTAGIKFTVDTTVEYDQGDQYEGSTYYGPKSIKRVSIESINGKPFDVNATYAVVSNDFCAAGGDTYYAFKIAENVMDTGVPMDEAVVAYIKEVLGGVVPAAKYAAPRADLTIKTATAQPEVVAPAQPEVVAPAQSESATYVVVAGDSLWKISQKLFGTGSKWNELYQANKGVIKNPNLIYAGQVLSYTK